MTVSFYFGEDFQGLNWPSSLGNLLQRCTLWELVLPYMGGSNLLGGHRGRFGLAQQRLEFPDQSLLPGVIPAPQSNHTSPHRSWTSPTLVSLEEAGLVRLPSCPSFTHLLHLQSWSCGSPHFIGTDRWTLSWEILPVELWPAFCPYTYEEPMSNLQDHKSVSGVTSLVFQKSGEYALDLCQVLRS